MAQHLFATETGPSLPNLDSNFNDLYPLANLFTVSGSTLGYGNTPSAWNSSYRSIDFIGTCAAIVAGHDNLALFGCNAFVNSSGAYTYDGTGGAALYTVAAGTNTVAHTWNIAASGSAGAAITWIQAMKLDAGGNLLVGLSSAAVAQSGVWLSPAAASGIFAMHATGSASGTAYAGFYYNATGIGSITQNGTTGVAYNTTSDYRLKDVITSISASASGAFIDALDPRTWVWKSDGTAGAGFIAHELQAVSPMSVTGAKDAVDDEGQPIYQAVEYGSAEVIAMMVAELKALRARVATLEG